MPVDGHCLLMTIPCTPNPSDADFDRALSGPETASRVAPVYFHNPWYTTWGGFKGDDCSRQALEPLLNMYGADLVFNGELETLTRTLPLTLSSTVSLIQILVYITACSRAALTCHLELAIMPASSWARPGCPIVGLEHGCTHGVPPRLLCSASPGLRSGAERLIVRSAVRRSHPW